MRRGLERDGGLTHGEVGQSGHGRSCSVTSWHRTAGYGSPGPSRCVMASHGGARHVMAGLGSLGMSRSGSSRFRAFGSVLLWPGSHGGAGLVLSSLGSARRGMAVGGLS